MALGAVLVGDKWKAPQDPHPPPVYPLQPAPAPAPAAVPAVLWFARLAEEPPRPPLRHLKLRRVLFYLVPLLLVLNSLLLHPHPLVPLLGLLHHLLLYRFLPRY